MRDRKSLQVPLPKHDSSLFAGVQTTVPTDSELAGTIHSIMRADSFWKALGTL